MEIRGRVGRIEWHYFTAAAIEGYVVHRDGPQTGAGRWSVAATVVLSDRFKLAQRPLTFVAPMATRTWRWPIEQFTLHEGGRFEATLGPPGEQQHVPFRAT